MVKILAGPKGTGKTKRLVDLVVASVNAENGDVVVIEKDKTLTYDIPYRARLIDAAEYGVNTYDTFKGFLCGIQAGNYDITHVYIDNFLKIVNDKQLAGLEAFAAWLDAFSEKNGIEYVLSVSAEADALPASLKAYII